MTLPRLRIANPCSVTWESMVGDARVRHCPSCDKHVYNVIQLSRSQLARLITEREGALPCMRLYQRPDGTVMTRRCLAGVERAARLAWWRLSLAAGFVVALIASGLGRVREAAAAVGSPPIAASDQQNGDSSGSPPAPKQPKPKPEKKPNRPPPPPEPPLPPPLGGAPMIDM